MGAYTNDRRNNNLRACFFFLVFFFFFFLFPSFSFYLHWTAFFTMHMQTGHSSSRRIAPLLAFVSNRSGAQPAAKKKRRSTKKEMSGWCTTPPSSSLPPSGFGFILTSSIALQPRPFLVLLLVTLVIVHFCPSSTDFLNDDRTSTHEDVYSRKRPTTVNAVFQARTRDQVEFFSTPWCSCGARADQQHVSEPLPPTNHPSSGCQSTSEPPKTTLWSAPSCAEPNGGGKDLGA